MKAAIFRGGDIVVDTLPEPVPARGQVLVKTLACGICGSDLHAAKHAHRMVAVTRRIPGRVPMDLSRDVVFGHEFCCEVLDYGPDTERKVKPGARVCAMPLMMEADGPQGHGLLQHLCRRLCRADAARRAAAARSAQRPADRACRAHRAAGGGRARGREGRRSRATRRRWSWAAGRSGSPSSPPCG